jgi:uncharacterized protein YjbI with pentapeptide repeats
LPLEDEVRRLLDAGVSGVVALIGEAGTGKTTALQHLAAVLPPDARIFLLDEGAKILIFPAAKLSVYVAKGGQRDVPQTAYRLAPWDDDDVLEYLLAVHRERCASVMTRLQRADRALCRGIPYLWSAVLDQLAQDDTIADGHAAMRRAILAALPDAQTLHTTRGFCLGAIVAAPADGTAVFQQLVPASVWKFLRHRPVQMLLAADLIADNLRSDNDGGYLARRLPRELVQTVATAVADETRCHDRLHLLLAGAAESHAMAASILHATGHVWMLASHRALTLSGAYLERVKWPGVALDHAKLDDASFTAADLSDADLRSAHAHRTMFGQCRLVRAILERIDATDTDFTAADLSEARAENARFVGANFQGANLADADLCKATLCGANLAGAVFRDAELAGANLIEAEIAGADFSGADFEGATLTGLRLGDAIWTGARFGAARMAGCDLEGLEFPGVCFEDANLEGALLTGCRMPGANFNHACLKNAGLGDVDWEGASLREADLRGATFHMGSTRSGLVGSPIASEGSRTGFYTDDYEEQYYKAPEEIRKANLCGADLRGAILDDVDFYLVDLRGARYDAEHEQQFRRCGAILHERVDE